MQSLGDRVEVMQVSCNGAAHVPGNNANVCTP